MREIQVGLIGEALSKLIEQASFQLGERETRVLRKASEAERQASARAILDQILKNADVAREEKRPLCQDTGVAVVFLDIGIDVRLTGGPLEDAVNEAVRRSYTELYLRKSMLDHPLTRINTGDNTPAIIHTRLVEGNRVRIRFDAKGGGCENMSRIAMLAPSAGRQGVVDFVVNAVKESGGNPCPPLVVGVGLGGTFERCALLAKVALLRPLNEPAAKKIDAELEAELLAKINATGVGPQGLGGGTTALAVHVESFACHIASLPVAVNLDCHSHRHAEATL